MNEPPAFLDPTARDAVHAAKNAAQAVEIARQVQVENAAEGAAVIAAEAAAARVAEKIVDEQRLRNIVNEAVMKGFSFEDKDERRRFIDVTKEKLICQSIVNISGRLDSIEGNLTWGVRIIIGAVLVALLSLVLIK